MVFPSVNGSRSAIFVDLYIRHRVGIDRAIGHGGNDGIVMFYLFQYPKMYSISMSIYHAHSIRTRVCRCRKLAGDVEHRLVHTLRHGDRPALKLLNQSAYHYTLLRCMT